MPTSNEQTAVAYSTAPLPALMPIWPDACEHAGKISRSKFYTDILPYVATVHIGTRCLVVVDSLNQFISARARPPRGR
jgi:hypothetical protein